MCDPGYGSLLLGVCNCLDGRVDVRPRPCAPWCVRVSVRVRMSEGPVCARERVQGVCLFAWPCVCRVCAGRPPGFAPCPALRFRGAAGCRAPDNRGGGPLLRPRVSRTLGLAAALWPGAGEGSKVGGGSGPGPKGAFGLRGRGWDTCGLCTRAGVRMRASAPVPVCSSSPGRQDGRVHEGPVHGQGGRRGRRGENQAGGHRGRGEDQGGCPLRRWARGGASGASRFGCSPRGLSRGP